MPSARPLSMFAAFAAICIIGARLPSNADPTLGVPVTPTGAAGPPVEIDECKLLYSGNWVAGQSAGVQMKFTNDSILVADVINFRVTATGGESGIIRDVGKFSPGIEITHTYKEGNGHMMFAPLFSHPHLECTLASVHFADGSVWQLQSPPPASTSPMAGPSAPLSSAPSSLAFSGTGDAFDQFLTIKGTGPLGTIRQSGDCTGIVSVKKIAGGPRSAALRVSPLAGGSCTIMLSDQKHHSIVIPVAVSVM
jgi:hypothetical protein